MAYYPDNKTYDAHAPYTPRQGAGGYQPGGYRPGGGYGGYPPQSPPPQNNNTVKIILIVAGAVIAIALMAVVAYIVLHQPDDPVNTGGSAARVTTATSPAVNNTQNSAAATIAGQKMPDVTGMSKEDAISRLSAIGVTVKEIKETETDKAKPGFVFDQVPAKDRELMAGEEVTLYVAKQKTTVAPVTQPAPKPTPAPTVAPPVTNKTYLYCNAADYVSLRRGKGVEYDEILRIPSRGKMEYIRTEGEYYYVRYGNSEGYVHGAYVSFDPNAPINYSGYNYD